MENEIIFKNTSKMNHEEISLFQNSMNKKVSLITSIIFAVIFAGIGTGLSFWDLTCGIIVVVCGLLGAFVLLPYLMKENLKKMNRETLGDKKYLNTFEFFEDCFAVTTEGSPLDKDEYETLGTQKVYYKDLFKAVVYKQHIFIFLNPRQSFILDYKGMTKGTAGELVELLKTHNVKIKDNSLKA